jgi:hypothetical protein
MARTFELVTDRGVLRVGLMSQWSPRDFFITVMHRIKLMSGAFFEYRYRKIIAALDKRCSNLRKFYRDAVILLILDVRYRQ